MHQLPLLWSNNPPSSEKYFFPIYSNILFLRTHREMIYEQWNYIDVQIYLTSLWNMKYSYSFLFVMIIISAAIDTCYWYGSAILPTAAFSFDCSIKIWHTRSCAGSIMHSTRTFVITVSNDRASCRPRLSPLLSLQSLHARPVAWLPLTIVTSCLEQLNLLTKASMVIARVDQTIVPS